MGCFLACFGFKKKKKRRNSAKKSPSGEQNYGSYVPLDSNVSIKLDIKENHFTSESNQHKEKPKEPSILKIKKKVSFNLNVKAYEPIPNDDDDISMYLSGGEEETKWEFNAETKNMATLHFEEDSIASTITSSHANYRYQNCRDSYDDLKLDDNDLNFDDIDVSDEELDDDVVYSDESDGDDRLITGGEDEVITAQEKNRDLDLQDKEPEGLRSKSCARDRNRYVFSVLNPVENLTQWKAVKANSATPKLKKCEKENLLMSNQDPDSLAFKKTRNTNVSPQSTIAVDASLSNWLGSL